MTHETLKKATVLVARIEKYKDQLKKLLKAKTKTITFGDTYESIIGFSINDAKGPLKPLFESVLASAVDFIKSRIEELEKQLDEL